MKGIPLWFQAALDLCGLRAIGKGRALLYQSEMSVSWWHILRNWVLGSKRPAARRREEDVETPP